MANPSLKAQIEAAKSALASGLAAPSLVVPPPEQPTAPIVACNDFATDATAKSTNANSGNDANPVLANPISADGKSAHATNAAALDERITQLEAKLLDNQRDLHTLLQKIREVSRLQANSDQSHKNQANDQAKTMGINEAGGKAVLRRSQKSLVIMVAMTALIGLVVGLACFLAIAKGGSTALPASGWISTMINIFNGWIG
tara:strand:- start:3692 stop:4294 length:603 start_codon:yes stop_codon:yes gene_type:complete